MGSSNPEQLVGPQSMKECWNSVMRGGHVSVLAAAYSCSPSAAVASCSLLKKWAIAHIYSCQIELMSLYGATGLSLGLGSYKETGSGAKLWPALQLNSNIKCQGQPYAYDRNE